ncbi:MAG TPA: S-layer homology domain-containing protein, partial [Chloroflexia bacterium]|nr:S-layer homology domain-containing protein [Chloroflexia bacterium]
LTAHWDGTSWTVVPSPNAGSPTSLNTLAAVATNDVWAAGYTGSGSARRTLVEHWDGSAWAVVPSPNVGSNTNSLAGLAAVATNDVWAGGYVANGSTNQTLIEHYSGPCVTPTGTPRAIGFSDVQPADYFYTPVLYLANQGVISGYADGTFLPYAETTRAQMVKIVVLGLNLPLTTPANGASTFVDVPPTHPFFAVVETAAARQIVGGYPCGGPGEACDGQNRAYFRPAANVTRGQLSKIVVAAAGWGVLTPATPAFTDVAPGSPFYPFVETAVCHGVVSGYTDQTFRPANPATRGQIAKIVYLAVTAGSSCGP